MVSLSIIPVSVALGQTASLTVDEGVVVKFGDAGGLTVRDRLHTSRNVVLTSIEDDQAGGQTGELPGLPAAGDWLGVLVDPDVAPTQLTLDYLDIRYAGAQGRAALDIAQNDYLFQFLSITNSVTGIRVHGGEPVFDSISLVGNVVGLETNDGAEPVVHGSDISGNSQYGIRNLSPSFTVVALDNWWGASSGPQHPIDNPAGEGDAVSDGVDFGQFLDGVPLIDCSVAVAGGVYTVSTRSIELDLACRNAEWVRLSEDETFGDGTDPFFPISAQVPFLLSEESGARRIHAEFRAATDNTVVVQTPQDVVYAPGVPSVSIVSPAHGDIIATDVLIQAVADDEDGIESVTFFVNGTPLLQDTAPPYEALWILGDSPDGTYTLWARALNSNDIHADAQITVTLDREPPDEDGPTIADLRFAGDPLQDGATVGSGGLLTFQVSDPSGIGSVLVTLAGQTVAGGFSGGQYIAPLSFDTVENGVHPLVIQARDTLENETEMDLDIDVQVPAPPAPTLTQPADGAVVATPSVAVAGAAMVGSQVQLYLDDAPVGGLLTVSGAGAFSATIPLAGEGVYAISADARNSRGTSARSAANQVSFVASPPSVLITSPVEGAVLSEDVEVAVQASDALGLARVELFIDAQLVATLTEPPYSWAWAIEGMADGPHEIRAEATNIHDKTSIATRHVVIEHPPEEPPPVVTPYTGIVDSVTPALSYGEQNVTIVGRTVIARDDETPVPDALVALILDVGGFQRRINVTSNAAGQFSFVFVPSSTDAGTYQVGARHPDEPQPVFDPGAEFTINRLTVNPVRYTLRAAYTVPSTIPVRLSASAGSGINGVTLVPEGTLPSGLQLTLPSVVDIPPSGQVNVQIGFLADSGVEASGFIVLKALSSDSGAVPRGTFRIDYQLSEPQPALSPQPTQVMAGVIRGESVTGSFAVRNQGLAAAEGVQVQLRDQNGGIDVPAWVNLDSNPVLGMIDVGENKTMQISANPHVNVPEGIYHLRARISASNVSAGDVPIAIAVTQDGQGGAEFHVADIYTATEGPDEEPILGVANARVRLQNEVIYTNTHSATTDENGTAVFDDIPAGRYNYRVSGPNHIEASGRVHIQPGIAVFEEVFLDYNLVTFEWEVTETTIEDSYEIVIEAIFQTQVPAPVVVMQPSFVNLPAMQVGEEITGVLTISNYGLLRADNVEFIPAADDTYFSYEFLGEIPTSLEAGERITLPYKVTSLSALPEPDAIGDLALPGAALFGGEGGGINKSGGGCHNYGSTARLTFGYECANGAVRTGSASTTFGRRYGSCSSGSSGGSPGNGGSEGGGWGGWAGGGVGAPMSGTPGCMPDCDSCSCQPGGGGGG